mmetsp:Transcript_16213/g.33446  ORF Transcript_16213/g.33446 Transcript_16213/m.33446 type:complete len:80 (+) Transcript_16213:271-510(+)
MGKLRCDSYFRGGARQDESYHNDSIRFDEEDDSSVSYTDFDFGESGDGLLSIHELVFSKDSSTVAVISRFYNDLHLFST